MPPIAVVPASRRESPPRPTEGRGGVHPIAEVVAELLSHYGLKGPECPAAPSPGRASRGASHARMAAACG